MHREPLSGVGVPSTVSVRCSRPPRLAMKAGVFGIGSALPEHIVTNADFAAYLDTTDAWIVRRTGIRERRRLNGSVTLTELAAAACADALRDAKPRRLRRRPRHRLVDHARPADAGPRARRRRRDRRQRRRRGRRQRGPAPASSTPSTKPPRSSSPGARSSSSSAAPRRCHGSPTRTTAARRSCSPTAPPRSSSPAASWIAAARHSSCAPTAFTATCSTRPTTSA